MNCKIFKERLEGFLEEELGAGEVEAFRSHGQICPQCHELLEDAKFARHVTRTAFPQDEWVASPHFFSRLWQSIENEQSQGFSWLGIRDLAIRFVMGVAMIMVILIGIEILSIPRLNENQLAIENYMEAPGAPDSFRDVIIGDLSANRDQLLQNLLQRDRQQSAPPRPVVESPESPSNKIQK